MSYTITGLIKRQRWKSLPLYICFPVVSVTRGRFFTRLIPSLKPQITEAVHGGMFILEWVDCLSCLWAEGSGTARCSSSNHVISSVILAQRFIRAL